MRSLVLRAALAVLGVASIVATGGGGPTGAPNFNSIMIYVATISPSHVTVQVGMPVTFKVTTNVIDPRFQWCRAAPGSGDCIPFSAGEASYTLPAASLADDGARFKVTITGSRDAQAGTDFAGLSVSPLPPVIFQDGEFHAADWAVTTKLSPDPGSTATVTRKTGLVEVSYELPNGPQDTTWARVMQEKVAANYVPTSQGAIYLIDFTMDCRLGAETAVVGSESGLTMQLLVEQGGRMFRAGPSPWPPPPRCLDATRWASFPLEGLEADNFVPVEGPSCSAGGACLDFSANAPPIRFGMYTAAYLPGRRSHALDNWKVTIWRR